MSSGSHTLDTDTQTPLPPTNANTSKLKSFTNGTQKHHHPATAPPPQPPPMVVSYKECLKNHAASIGGHALDGCGEFMPSSSTNPTDPRSLRCAACGCHRNFHRRDPLEPPPPPSTTTTTTNNPTFLTCFYSNTPSSAPPQPPPPPLPHRAMSQTTSPSLSSSPSHSPSPMSSPSSPPPLSHLPPSFHTSSAPHMLLALGNAYSAAPSDEHHHYHRNFNTTSLVLKTENYNNNNNPSGKKRYRTKFSQEQKEKMYSFSEKLGWRMQKGDDGLVQEFCNDIGVSRGVFKVWMHNNKNTLRKRSSDVVGIANAPPQTEKINGDHDDDDDDDDDNDNHGRGSGGGGGAAGFDSDINNDIHRNEDSCVNVHVSINGLSS